MKDPYLVLGVGRDAKQDEIRRVYRRLAKENHPDLHPGDKGAEARYKEIAAAYAIVGDEAKRALFDSGKIDASGAERPQQAEREFYRSYAEGEPGFKYERRQQGGGGTDDVFDDLFGGRAGGFKMRGPDASYGLAVDFLEAIKGAKKRVTMPDGKVLDISIPRGLKDGQVLRLRGQGHPGIGGGPTGDALVEIQVRPHPLFRRDGNDIRSSLPVTPGEALAGARVAAQTLSGPVELTIPRGSNGGTVLRLRGKGVEGAGGAGDHFMELRIVLPDAADEELVRCVTEWEAKHPFVPGKAEGARS